ncbi:VirB3 family type IV secretion system protein [Robbsia andropogonis]|nr:VirB3 family type IV secretion system protein [Robbsia andropogonis]
MEVDGELIEPRTMLRIDRRLAIAVIMVPFMLFQLLHIYWLIILIGPGWLFAWFGTKDDVDIFNIYVHYRNQGDSYVPRQVLPQKRNLRPEGFARGVLC